MPEGTRLLRPHHAKLGRRRAMLFVSFSYADAILTSSGLPNGRVAKSTPTGSRAATGPTSHVPSADDGSGTHERITCEAAGALYRRREIGRASCRERV